MAMKWVEAHRKLDAGIPVSDEEFEEVESSLNLFYWGQFTVFVILVFAAIAIWGIPSAHKKEDDFVRQCEARGGKVDKGFLWSCDLPEAKDQR